MGRGPVCAATGARLFAGDTKPTGARGKRIASGVARKDPDPIHADGGGAVAAGSGR